MKLRQLRNGLASFKGVQTTLMSAAQQVLRSQRAHNWDGSTSFVQNWYEYGTDLVHENVQKSDMVRL